MASRSTAQASHGGPGITGLLGIAFVVLKLTHVINWSWWWVTLPFWGGVAIAAAISLIGLVIIIILNILDK